MGHDFGKDGASPLHRARRDFFDLPSFPPDQKYIYDDVDKAIISLHKIGFSAVEINFILGL